MAARSGYGVAVGRNRGDPHPELENEVGCFFDRIPTARCTRRPSPGKPSDRTVHKGDLTGIEIISRLMEQVLAAGVDRLEEHRAIGLIPAKGRRGPGGRVVHRHAHRRIPPCARQDGADGDRRRADHVRYHTPSGDKIHGRPGDGAARAGLPLRDMEMVQFHPTGLLAGEHTDDRHGSGRRLARCGRASAERREQRFMFDYDRRRAGDARCGQPRHLRRNAASQHHAERRRLYLDGAPGAGECARRNSAAWSNAAPTAASIWRQAWSRSCRPPTT